MTLFEQGHALIIGVGADLPNTVDDARGVADILRDPARCAYPAPQVALLTGAEATRAAILTQLDALAKLTHPQATVILYFSGHGYQVTSTTGQTYYLMPYGYDVARLYQTAISGTQLLTRLAAIPAQKLVLLLDCCHAGGVGDAKTVGVELAKAPLPQAAIALFTQGAGRVLIASSKENELSYAGRPYSAFTLALLEAFSGVGLAKEDGYVRVSDLALHARQVVPGRTRDRQHPILHFEHADNFALAYYAGGETQPKGLPFTAAPEIEPEPGAWSIQHIETRTVTASGERSIAIGGDMQGGVISTGDTINTGGGAFVRGNVDTGGGAFVGRDQTIQPGAAGTDPVAALFTQLRTELPTLGLCSPDQRDLQTELVDLEVFMRRGDAATAAHRLRAIRRLSPTMAQRITGALSDPTSRLGAVATQILRAFEHP